MMETETTAMKSAKTIRPNSWELAAEVRILDMFWIKKCSVMLLMFLRINIFQLEISNLQSGNALKLRVELK